MQQKFVQGLIQKGDTNAFTLELGPEIIHTCCAQIFQVD
jgi:hypothetical protein